MKRMIVNGLMVTSAILLAAGSSVAAMNSSSHLFQVELSDGCTVDTTGLVSDVGTYQVGTPDLINVSLGQIGITCVTAVTYDWGIDGGLYFAASGRNLVSPASPFSVAYNLRVAGGNIGDSGLEVLEPGYLPTAPPMVSYAGIVGAAPLHPGGATTVPYNLEGDFYIGTATDPGIYTDTVSVTVVWP